MKHDNGYERDRDSGDGERLLGFVDVCDGARCHEYGVGRENGYAHGCDCEYDHHVHGVHVPLLFLRCLLRNHMLYTLHYLQFFNSHFVTAFRLQAIAAAFWARVYTS